MLQPLGTCDTHLQQARLRAEHLAPRVPVTDGSQNECRLHTVGGNNERCQDKEVLVRSNTPNVTKKPGDQPLQPRNAAQLYRSRQQARTCARLSGEACIRRLQALHKYKVFQDTRQQQITKHTNSCP